MHPCPHCRFLPAIESSFCQNCGKPRVGAELPFPAHASSYGHAPNWQSGQAHAQQATGAYLAGAYGLPHSTGNGVGGYAGVPVSMLRSQGETVALWVGLGGLAITWLFSDLITGILPLLLVTGGIIVYTLFQQGAMKGSGVAITPSNFPGIDVLAIEAAQRLAIAKPPVFIEHSRHLNAYAMGFVGTSCVVLTSETVHALQHHPRELQFIIGHEFTHIKCSHILWQTIAANNPVLGKIPGLSWLLQLFFSWWSRQAEFTADRGGYLACGDLLACQKALARLAIGAELFEQMNINAFLQQCQDGDMATHANELFSSHPLLAKRILALAQYARTGNRSFA